MLEETILTEEVENTEDSTGATEVAIEPEKAEPEETVEAEEGGDEPESEEGELQYYQIGDIEATAQEIAEWREAHSKKRDTDKAWTEKTQALSAERKAFEAKRSQIENEIETFESLQSDIERALLGEFADADLDKILDESGADEHLRIKREIDKRKSAYAAMREKHEASKKSYYEKAYQELAESLGWSDEEKRQADIKAISSYVQDAGIADRDFAKVTSPKIMEAMLEAAKYRDLMKKRETVQKKVVKAPTVAKPSKVAKDKPMNDYEYLYGKD